MVDIRKVLKTLTQNLTTFAKQNKRCLHNLHYWNLDPYISFGPSAHSYDTKKRWWNIKYHDKYLKMISNGELPIQGYEALDVNEKFNELKLTDIFCNCCDTEVKVKEFWLSKLVVCGSG